VDNGGEGGAAGRDDVVDRDGAAGGEAGFGGLKSAMRGDDDMCPRRARSNTWPRPSNGALTTNG
jgi:hypothetical protein